MRGLLSEHLEAVFWGSMWLTAEVLAVYAGRPWLGLIGLVTVFPALILYARRPRR